MLGFQSISEAPISAQSVIEDGVLILPLLTNTSTLYEPTVIPEQLVVIPLLSNSNTFYDFVLGLEGELPTLTNINNLYAPSVQFVVDLPYLTNTSTLYAPTISAFNAILPIIVNTSVLYAMSSSLTPAELVIPHLANQSELYLPYKVGRQQLVFTGVSYILE